MERAELNAVIVRAKAASYVGGGVKAPSSRMGSHDLSWSEGDWRYLDSYFGGTDFLGQEVLWYGAEPVWAMSYYGYVLRPELTREQNCQAMRAAQQWTQARSENPCRPR